jgi:hypothetical protein
MSLSVRGTCTQNFQVLKLGKYSYCLSGLELETNLSIEIEKDLDNAAEEKIILKCTITIIFWSLNYIIQSKGSQRREMPKSHPGLQIVHL